MKKAKTMIIPTNEGEKFVEISRILELEGVTWAVHRNYLIPGVWVVSEYTTGLAAPIDVHMTRAGAIKALKTALEDYKARAKLKGLPSVKEWVGSITKNKKKLNQEQ